MKYERVNGEEAVAKQMGLGLAEQVFMGVTLVILLWIFL